MLTACRYAQPHPNQDCFLTHLPTQRQKGSSLSLRCIYSNTDELLLCVQPDCQSTALPPKRLQIPLQRSELQPASKSRLNLSTTHCWELTCSKISDLRSLQHGLGILQDCLRTAMESESCQLLLLMPLAITVGD